MLQPSMNYKEEYVHIIREYLKLRFTNIERIVTEYDLERNKLKIKSESNYFKGYTIKTKGKNTWMLFIHKTPSKQKYIGEESINFLCIIYSYNNEGLKVISIDDDLFITEFDGHFFKRYNEILSLNLHGTLDIVKTFFKNCRYTRALIIEKNNTIYTLAIAKDGFLLGEYKDSPTSIEWKTFMEKDFARHSYNEIEKQIVDELKKEIEEAIESAKGDADIFETGTDLYLPRTA